MRLQRRLLWIPLALSAALAAASAPTLAQIAAEPPPAPYGYSPYGHSPGDGPGSCYEDSLQGRVCRD